MVASSLVTENCQKSRERSGTPFSPPSRLVPEIEGFFGFCDFVTTCQLSSLSFNFAALSAKRRGGGGMKSTVDEEVGSGGKVGGGGGVTNERI